MSTFDFDWYHKQQEKKKEDMRKQEIFLINQELKRILQRLQSFIQRNNYQKEAQRCQRYLFQSSIWNVTYRNNMENEQVALEQALLILTILSKESDVPHKKGMEIEVERQMRRLGNVSWGIYMTYQKRKWEITREQVGGNIH